MYKRKCDWVFFKNGGKDKIIERYRIKPPYPLNSRYWPIIFKTKHNTFMYYESTEVTETEYQPMGIIKIPTRHFYFYQLIRNVEDITWRHIVDDSYWKVNCNIDRIELIS